MPTDPRLTFAGTLLFLAGSLSLLACLLIAAFLLDPLLGWAAVSALIAAAGYRLAQT